MLDLHNTPFPDAGEPTAAQGILLLLARQGDAWGLAAARAAADAGYEVERCDDAADALALIDETEGAEAEVEAVLVVARALAASRPANARELSRRTADAGLPVVVLADPGLPPSGPLAYLQHVTVVETPPSERVLAAVLSSARRERETRRRLHRLSAELDAADRREQRLLARVGHELRNPLGAITSALSLIEEASSAGRGGGADEARYRQLIQRQVDSLRRAVDGLLTNDPAALASAGNDNEKITDPAPARSHAGNGKTRVLLVEDDEDGRQALGELLGLWGYEVEIAGDGEEGLALAAQRAPQVALVDVGLPGIDGYEVARRLRRNNSDDTPLLVAMTGFGQPEDRRRALEAGFDLHLVKPLRPSKLATLLAEAGTGSSSDN